MVVITAAVNQTNAWQQESGFCKYVCVPMPSCRFIDGPPGVILAEQFACKARLVLHFDVNKTIIMTDKAQGSDMSQMLNMLLSECAWGRLEPGPLWVPVGRLATDR